MSDVQYPTPRYDSLIDLYGRATDAAPPTAACGERCQVERMTEAEWDDIQDQRIAELDAEIAELRAAMTRQIDWRDRVDDALARLVHGWGGAA